MNSESRIQVVCELLEKMELDSLKMNFTTFRLSLEENYGIDHSEVIEIVKKLYSEGYYLNIIEEMGF